MHAKSLCTPRKPVEDLSSAIKCVKCGEVAKAYTMFLRSYYRSIFWHCELIDLDDLVFNSTQLFCVNILNHTIGFFNNHSVPVRRLIKLIEYMIIKLKILSNF